MFGLTSQIRRAAGSIGANLAEGCRRWGDPERPRFVQILMDSASDLQNHLRLAHDLGFLNPAQYSSASKELIGVRQMITAFLQSLKGVRGHNRPLRSLWRKANSEGRKRTMKIGVLALQGDFDAHRRRLEELGAEVALVRNPEDFDHLDGLVIPGGESSTFLKLLGERTLSEARQVCSHASRPSALVPARSCWRAKWRIQNSPV